MMYFPLYTDSVIPDYRFILSVIPFNNSFYATPREIRGIGVTKFKKTLTPGTIPPDDAGNLLLLHIIRHILQSLRNPSLGGARLHRLNIAFTGLTMASRWV